MTASTFRYASAAVMAADPAFIMARIVDLRAHEAWSPFAKPDGKTAGIYEGAPGAGQSYGFSGGRSGAGRLVVDAVEARRAVMTLSMFKPVKAVNTVEFVLTPQADGVRVEWIMHGPVTLVSRITGLFIDCEAMCRGMFDQGLAELRTLVEADARPRLAA